MNPKEIGMRLRALREAVGKTIKEVHDETGLTVSAISNYENGIRIPRDEAKICLANYYKKSVQDIFFTS